MSAAAPDAWPEGYEVPIVATPCIPPPLQPLIQPLTP